MKALGTLTALVVVCCASTAMGTDLTLTIVSDACGSDVAPGAVVSYEVYGELSDSLNEGLALFGFDMEMAGVTLETAAIVEPGPLMTNFVEDLGLTNPAGFAGTPSGDVLLQIGGGQNTIKDTDPTIPPNGTVDTGLGKGGAVLLISGTITMPDVEGDYTLEVTNGFANVIAEGETGDPFWAVEAVGMVSGDTCTITVGGPSPGIAAAESLKDHGGEVFGQSLMDGYEQRASGVTTIDVTFEQAIVESSVEGNIAIEDKDGATYTSSWELSIDGLVLTVTPDAALTENCFTVSCAGMETTGGATLGGDNAEFDFFALEGDVDGGTVVNSVDASSIKPWFGSTPDAATFVFDLDVNGVINSLDTSLVKPRFGHSVTCP